MKLILAALTVCIFCMLSGCGQIQKNFADAQLTPVAIDNFDGYAGRGRLLHQEYKAVPSKVLAVSEAVVDNMLFLGLENKIAAVNQCAVDERVSYTLIYKKFRNLTGEYAYPSKEAVLDMYPDMIISWGSLFGDSALGSAAYWHEQGIHTYVMSNTVPIRASQRKVINIVKDLRNLAKIFRVEKENEVRISELEQRINSLESASKKLYESSKPTVITLQYIYGNEYYGRVASDLTADIIRIAGGKSLDDDLDGKKSIEYLIKANPDIIVVVDMPQRPAESKIKALKENRALRNVAAVKNNKFFKLPYRAFYCGSEYTVDAAEKLHRFIESGGVSNE